MGRSGERAGLLSSLFDIEMGENMEAYLFSLYRASLALNQEEDVHV